MIIDEPGDLVPIVVVLTAVLAGVLWLIRAQVSLSKEFRRNGGSSTKDQLWRIERDLTQIRERLDHHIDQHNARGN